MSHVDDVLAVLRTPRLQPADAAARLRLLDDESEIRDLIMRYAIFNDLQQLDDLLSLCTEDVERVLAGTLDQTAHGRDDLRAKFSEALTVATEDGGTALLEPAEGRPPGRSRHLITDEVIRVAGDRAAAVAQYALVLTSEDGEFRHGQHEGTYLFAFRREVDGWRFSRQVIISNTARNPLLTLRPVT
jgi:SnoaL-like protein